MEGRALRRFHRPLLPRLPSAETPRPGIVHHRRSSGRSPIRSRGVRGRRTRARRTHHPGHGRRGWVRRGSALRPEGRGTHGPRRGRRRNAGRRMARQRRQGRKFQRRPVRAGVRIRQRVQFRLLSGQGPAPLRRQFQKGQELPGGERAVRRQLPGPIPAPQRARAVPDGGDRDEGREFAPGEGQHGSARHQRLRGDQRGGDVLSDRRAQGSL
mmetsp:Transcript_33910/g.69233  ORF Transcript_33910/g.69233 Transcript_33910/m.69233 type:complete len:212 (+) Transcript_33910:545-1180(+)